MSDDHVTDHLRFWRAASLGDHEIVEGVAADEHAGPSASLAVALTAWDAQDAGSMHYTDTFRGSTWIVLVRERAHRPTPWLRHAILLALTLITTSAAGAAMTGTPFDFLHPVFARLGAGLAFSLPLAAILLVHEAGHYLAARRYRVNASLPYFVPFPPALSLLGTMGAFIRIRSVIFDRRTLFDIGVAGPIAGMAVALPVLLAGLALSHVAPLPPLPLAHQIVTIGGTPYFLGDSLATAAARALLGLSGTVALHPSAVAGWTGMLVTALNMLPLAQFDGGHITYAMSRRVQRVVAVYVWVALLGLGSLWAGWWLWAVVAVAVGRGRLGHPEVIAPERPLDRRRLILGWVAIAIFLLTFAPVPVGG